MLTFIIAMACVAIAYGLGWKDGKHSVAAECKRIGRFYVQGTAYECTKIRSVIKKQQHKKEMLCKQM